MFIGHSLSFQPIGSFRLLISPVQEAQARGHIVDMGYLGGSPPMEQFFNAAEAQYVDKSIKYQKALAISNSGDPTLATSRGPNVNAAISAASKAGQVTVDLVRTAMALASTASNQQVTAYAPTKKHVAGMAAEQFAVRDRGKGAEVFLRQMSRFMDPESLREGVATVSTLSTIAGHMDIEGAYEQAQQQAVSENLAMAAMEVAPDTGRRLALEHSINRIKYARNSGGSLVNRAMTRPIEKITGQFRIQNLFKPVVIRGRFA